MHQLLEHDLLLLGVEFLGDDLDEIVLSVRQADAVVADLLEDRIVVLQLGYNLIFALKLFQNAKAL